MNMIDGLAISQDIFYLAKKLKVVLAKGIGFKVSGIDIISAIKVLNYSCVMESVSGNLQSQLSRYFHDLPRYSRTTANG